MCNTESVNQKGFSALLILILIGLLSLSGGSFFYFFVLNRKPPTQANFEKMKPSSVPTSPSPDTQADELDLQKIIGLYPDLKLQKSTDSAEIPTYGALKGGGVSGQIKADFDYTQKLQSNSYWSQSGWQDDLHQAADGVTGSVWGYYKQRAGMRQIVNFNWQMNESDADKMFKARENLTEFNCPCKYELTIFMSDWFSWKE